MRHSFTSACRHISLLALLALLVLMVAASLPAQAGAEVRGVSLAHMPRGDSGYGSDSCREQLAAIKATGANWVAISDFAGMDSVTEPTVRYGGRGFSESDGLEAVIRDARAIGLKVLVKPHIWSRQFWQEQKWHGDIKMTSEADWDEWFRQYGDYVLANARIAARAGAEALCVGVEYEGTSDQEARWRKLIADVREVYPGHLTYAATFMEWKKIKWWDAVDCIGIDAYWPVATSLRADDDEIRAHWDRIYAEIEPFAKQWNKPVCFLELGYSASSHAGKEPWSYEIIEPDVEYQGRLYRIALEEAAKYDVVVGVFVWKWFTAEPRSDREPFLIQNREPVLDALRGAWQHVVDRSTSPPDAAAR